MLIETHLADLREQTHEIHYEAFRSACITRLTSAAAAQQQPQRERSKLKRDSILVQNDLSESDLLLQQKEEEIRQMQDMLSQMQHQLQAQQRSKSLGELQLKKDFSLINNDNKQEVHL